MEEQEPLEFYELFFINKNKHLTPESDTMTFRNTRDGLNTVP